jgi:hypothetical protein
MDAARNRGLILALAGVALLLAATRAAYAPVAPQGKAAAPSLFSAARAKTILQDLVGNGIPHPLGSPAAAQLRAGLVTRLSALGYAPELQSGFACNDQGVCGYAVNIVAELAGGSGDGNAVLLAAHYDSVPAGPGASDDGAGVASLLEIARILKSRPAPRHPVILLFSDGEEAGLLGAWLFVHEHPLSRHVKAAVNLDARGTSGPSLMFETGTANSWLMQEYESAVARPLTNSLYYVVYKQLRNDTDFTAFKAAGYQGFNFAYIGDVGLYHTPLDTVAHADAGSIQHQGDNALAVLTALANAPDLRAPEGESVFFDVFSRTLIAWPSKFTLPAALLVLLLLLAEAGLLLRKGAVAGREILSGWAGTAGVLIGGTALCAGALIALIMLHAVPALDGASWISRPLPMHLAAAAMAVLAAAAVSAALWQRAGFWGFWLAAALQVAVLSVICAAFVPGASFVFLPTAIASGLGALPCAVSLWRSTAPRPWALDTAALLPALTQFATVLPLVGLMYVSLGSPAWPLSTLLLGLGTSVLLPLMAIASGRLCRVVRVIAALITVTGLLITVCSPVYSAQWPERINLEYWLDADTGESHFLARCDSMRLPEALAAQFDSAPRPRFAGSATHGFYAAAPTLALAAPELSRVRPTWAAAVTAGSGTHFVLHLRSARGAPEAFVVFPADAQVAEVALAGAAGPVRAKTYPLPSGATLLDIVGLPAAGVELSFDAAASPLKVQVFDQSDDFPDHALLRRARGANATSSQNGDLTVVHRTVSLDPAADRG